MTEHEKRIREALCLADQDEELITVVASRDLRALLADLDSMREVLEAIELALKIPGMTGLQILDENSPIRDSIRAALKGASHE